MNLYLSSYLVGNRGAELAELLGPRKHVAVIRNAVDYSHDEARHQPGTAPGHAYCRQLFGEFTLPTSPR